MKKLREIISCIDFDDLFYLPVWEARLRSKARLYELYCLILDKPEADDAELCWAYLGRELHSTYYRAKARLFEELASLLFLQSFLGAGQQERSEDWLAYRNFLLGRKLLRENKYAASLALLSSVKKYCKRGRIQAVTFEAMRLLRYFFTMVKGDWLSFREISTEETKALQVFRQELILSTEVEALMLCSFGKKPRVSKALSFKNSAFQGKTSKTSLTKLPYLTPLLVHHRFFLEAASRMRAGDYKGTIEVGERAIEALEQFDTPASYEYIQTFKLQQASCYLQLNMQEEMENALLWLQNHAAHKAVMQVLTLELKCKWLLRKGAYEEAWEAVCQAERLQVLPKMSKAQQENWQLLKGYTCFFVSSLPGKEKDAVYRFRIQKMLSDLSVLYRDKKGYYSTIIILQILFYLKDNKRDRLIDMIEALEKYVVRHLGGDRYLRTRIYIRMLLLLPKNNYCADTCRKKAGFYLKQLHSSEHGLKPLSHDIEIIPYEILWNTALSLVRRKSC